MIAAETFDWAKWLEHQGPLWVIYAMVIVWLISIGRLLFKYVPIVLEKHIEMLTIATETMAKCASSFDTVKLRLDENSVQTKAQNDRFSDAARPFANAICAIAHADSKAEVRQHLTEMETIMRSGS